MRKRSLSGIGIISQHLDKLVKDDKTGVESPVFMMEVEEKVEYDEIMEKLKEFVSRPENYKFRSKVVKEKYFEEIPNYVESVVEKNFKILDLKNCTEEEMGEKVVEISQESFDLSLPPYMFYITRNYHKNLIIFKCNHIMGDGISVGKSFMSFMDEEKEYFKVIKEQYKVTENIFFKIKFYGYLLIMFIPSMIYFFLMFIGFFGGGKKAKSFYGGKLTRKRSLSWVRGLKLSEFKKISSLNKKKLTVNEVFMSLLSHSLSEVYNVEKQFSCRMSLPISTRLRVPEKPGNTFGAHFCQIPMKANMDWYDRTKLVKKYSKRMKRYPLHFYCNYLLRTISFLLPSKLCFFVFNEGLKRQNFITSNIPTPPYPCRLNKKRIMDLGVLIPLNPGCLFSAGLLTYNDQITIVFVFDDAFKDKEKFMNLFKEKYNELLDEVNKKKE